MQRMKRRNSDAEWLAAKCHALADVVRCAHTPAQVSLPWRAGKLVLHKTQMAACAG
jgi:hypothetical protein